MRVPHFAGTRSASLAPRSHYMAIQSPGRVAASLSATAVVGRPLCQGRQVDQASVCRAKATGVEVEASEIRLEVHVKPLTSGCLGVNGCSPD
jgi:hypothetical protein